MGQGFHLTTRFMNKPHAPSEDIDFFSSNSTKKKWYHYCTTGRGYTFCRYALWPKNRYKLLKTRMKLSDVDKSCMSDSSLEIRIFFSMQICIKQKSSVGKYNITGRYHRWWVPHIVLGGFRNWGTRCNRKLLFPISLL